MECNGSWHLLGNPKLMWHPACLIKEGGCVDLSVDTMHLKEPLVLFGSEGSAPTVRLVLLSPRILCHFSSTATKDHFLKIVHGTKWPLCANVPLSLYLFFHSQIQQFSLNRQANSTLTKVTLKVTKCCGGGPQLSQWSNTVNRCSKPYNLTTL